MSSFSNRKYINRLRLEEISHFELLKDVIEVFSECKIDIVYEIIECREICHTVRVDNSEKDYSLEETLTL